MPRLWDEGHPHAPPRPLARGNASPRAPRRSPRPVRSAQPHLGASAVSRAVQGGDDPRGPGRGRDLHDRWADLSRRRSPADVCGSPGDLIMPRAWSQSYTYTIRIALLYRASGQYRDAAIEFLWAAEVAPSEGEETAMLDTAFFCLQLDARDDWGGAA